MKKFLVNVFGLIGFVIVTAILGFIFRFTTEEIYHIINPEYGKYTSFMFVTLPMFGLFTWVFEIFKD